MTVEVRGQRVLVTGASQGIGRSLARHFAADGAHLVLSDLPGREAELIALGRELGRAHGIQTWHVCADLTLEDGPGGLFSAVLEKAGPVDILVNNAGLCWYGEFARMPPERLEKMVLLNCLGGARLARCVLPAMIARGSGAVLTVSSVAAFQALPTMALYAATKAFVQSLSEALGAELRGSGIHVATINPPFTRTALIDDAGLPADFIPLSLSFKDVSAVTRSCYTAFRRGRLLHVPGWQNRLLHLGAARFLPRGLVNTVSRLMMRRWCDFLPTMRRQG